MKVIPVRRDVKINLDESLLTPYVDPAQRNLVCGEFTLNERMILLLDEQSLDMRNMDPTGVPEGGGGLIGFDFNDTRVDVWMTTKTATRFRAAQPAGKPVLMRLEYDAGHGAGATRRQAQQRLADRWTFVLWQAGVAQFQPVP